MSSIYNQATQTLIWLGEDWSERSKQAALLSTPPYIDSSEVPLANTSRYFDILCRLVNSWHSEVVANYQVCGNFVWGEIGSEMPKLQEYEWDWLKDFFNTNWFSRRWVIQEVVLSKNCTVLRGDCAISWWVVGFAAARLRTHYHDHREYIYMKGAHNAYLIFRLGSHGALKPINVKFLELFRLAADFDTTDSRYKIFALLGIQAYDHNYAERPLIFPDYSVDKFDLDLTFAEALLQTAPPLAFLSGAQRSETQRLDPSGKYLHGYQIGILRNPLQSLRPGHWMNNSTHREVSSLVEGLTKLEHSSWFPVSGIHISTILLCGSDSHSATEFNIKEVDEIAHLGLLKATPEVLGLLSRTLSAGRTQYGGKESDPNALLKHFAALYASEETRNVLKLSNATHPFISHHGQALISMAQQVQEGGDSRKFCHIADQVTSDRKLFITASGHLGLGPDWMKPGHELCVLAGSPMPVILNPEENYHEFIGDCFVDGIMEGEAVEALRSGLSIAGPSGKITTLPILEEYVHLHPSAEGLVRKLQKEMLTAFYQQMTGLKEVEFDIR